MLGLTPRQSQRQSQQLGAQQINSLRLLAMSLPELRMEIAAAMSSNPAIEDYDHPLETPLSEVERSRKSDEITPDYPEDDFVPGTSRDEEAAERRQAFFDNQVKTETLQAHLLAQLPLSDIPTADWPLVEVLVGDLNDDGFYIGSVPDVMMAFGRSEKEVTRLLGRITEFDPPGCGARTARECLLAQLDTLGNSPNRGLVRRVIESHLEEIAAGELAKVASELKVDLPRLKAALTELRGLSSHPGRAFPSESSRVEYVNPEVHAVWERGRWLARTDRRSLPEIRISKQFEQLLSDPQQTEETRKYVRERIEAVQTLREAVTKRQETIEQIAQTIFDRQPDFFDRGFAALRPLTEAEVAKAVGVSESTVSRTVRDKYASTPKGTIELRRFFITGFRNTEGSVVSQEAVKAALRRLVDEEDSAAPLSDERLVALLKEQGFPVARRTVAKYRGLMGIPCARDRT